MEELFVESGEEESSTATHEVSPRQEGEAEVMRLVAAVRRTVSVAMPGEVVKSKEPVEATKAKVEVMKEMGKVKAAVVKEMGAVAVKVAVAVAAGKRFEQGEKVAVKKT